MNEAERQPSISLGLARVYPERFAQEALGHNSKAVHRTYAKRAQVLLPPLEDYEKKKINSAPPPTVAA